MGVPSHVGARWFAPSSFVLPASQPAAKASAAASPAAAAKCGGV